jgi:hypothetical protein
MVNVVTTGFKGLTCMLDNVRRYKDFISKYSYLSKIQLLRNEPILNQILKKLILSQVVKKIVPLSWKPHYRLQKKNVLGLILSESIPYTLHTLFSNIHFNIIFPSTPGSQIITVYPNSRLRKVGYLMYIMYFFVPPSI